MYFPRQAGGIVHREHSRQGLPGPLWLPSHGLGVRLRWAFPSAPQQKGNPEAALFMDLACARDGLCPLPIEEKFGMESHKMDLVRAYDGISTLPLCKKVIPFPRQAGGKVHCKCTERYFSSTGRKESVFRTPQVHADNEQLMFVRLHYFLPFPQ